jgi:hypothetical protein
MPRLLFLASVFVLLAPPVLAQTGGGAGGQGASTAPTLRYGAELLLGRSHAQGGGGADAGGSARGGDDRSRVVLRRHGAETMPAIQAGQVGQAARLEVQEIPRPADNRLLSGGQAGGGRAEGRIIPFGAERTVEGGGGGAGGQGGERPRLAAFPPRDPSTAPGASRAAAGPGQGGQARPTPPQPRPPAAQARPAAPPPQARPAAPVPRPQASQPSIRPVQPGNVLQNSLPGGNRFSDIAHQDLPTPPILSEGTRSALDRLTPRQQEAYRASVRDMARSNPGRTLSEPEVRLLVEAAQSR